MSVATLSNRTVAVKKVTYTQNDMGGTAKTYTNRIASLSCRISPTSLNEADEFGKWTTRSIMRLYCEADSTNLLIIESDIIVDGSVTYQIKAITNPSLADKHLEIDLLEVD